MSQPATLPDGWQPGDLCQLCNVILLRHRHSDFACPDVMRCDNQGDALTHAHNDYCWLATTFKQREPAPLCHRCGREDGPHDCVTEEQERGDIGNDDL